MTSQPQQTVPPEVLLRLIEAAQALSSQAQRLLEAADSTRFAAAGARGDVVTEILALTPSQRAICERVLNVFETGTPRGRYGAITIFADGPHGIRQITYGRSQTTEYGNLRELVSRYVAAGGTFSEQLRSWVPLIGRRALVDDAAFKGLLTSAGNTDPVMERVQDAFFADLYFNPAMRWAAANGFRRALSALVIYDSYIHSGSIRDFLRALFPEVPPARGGDEKTWIQQYTNARHNWLANHGNADIRASAYRTRDLLREIGRDNWDLTLVPILANGTPVDDGGIGRRAGSVAPAAVSADDIPYLGNPTDGSTDVIWCEGADGAGAAGVVFSVAGASAADLAQRILASPSVSLATVHVSGRIDQATARQNIVDTAAGRQASRSAYEGAPGGTVSLDVGMLQGVLTLSQEYTLSISEFCGGSHSPNSRHYAGVTADINVINGEYVNPRHRDVPALMARVRQLGATEVLGPGFPGHDNHVHAAWPCPA